VRRATLAALLAGLAWLPAGAHAASPSGPPAAVPLTSGWELSMGERPGAWRPTTVPGVFDGTPRKSEFGGMVGWYRITFTGPRTPADTTWAIRFGSVRRVATAWLNGRPIGRHTDPYVPFELPAAGLKPGAPNTLLVRVDNRKAKEPREGWWNWGGITRAVKLIPRGRVTLAYPGLLYRGDGRMAFDGWVTNRSARRRPVRIAIALTAPSGRVTRVVRDSPAVGPGDTRRVRFDFRVARPELWSPERPQRYRTRITTSAGGRVEQRDDRLLGLRTVDVRAGRLYLNGKLIDVRGASIQEDVPGRGPALTDADVRGIVADLKAVHANVTRAHYLLDDRLLDALDAAGIMVWSQSPIYHRDRLLETEDQRLRALSTVRYTVLAARNHASVIADSVANELSVIPDHVDGTRRFLDAARTLTRDLDPSVPVAVDMLSYPGYDRQVTYSKFDLLGVNSYFGWYPGKKAHPTGSLSELRPYLLRMRRLYPASAMIVTEFGAESTHAGPADVKETYAFQQRFVGDTLGVIDELPFMSGAIYWTLREFAVKPDWDGGAQRKGVPRDAIHNKALITYSGKRKPAWNVAEHAFARTPLHPSLTRGLERPMGVRTWLVVIGVPLVLVALLAFLLWATRDLWRLTRPPEAEVVPLPTRRRAA